MTPTSSLWFPDGPHTSPPHPLGPQPGDVTQQSPHPRSLGADGPTGPAACRSQAFLVHAWLTPRHSGQPPLISQSVSAQGARGG